MVALTEANGILGICHCAVVVKTFDMVYISMIDKCLNQMKTLECRIICYDLL
jgi:hypothetical protein